MKIYTEETNEFKYPDMGNGEEPIYIKYVNANGETAFKVNGIRNLHQEIQEAAVGITLPELIKRYESGDLTALNAKAQQIYADISEVPKTIEQQINLLEKGKQAFYELPIELREKFDNNYIKFVKETQETTEDEFINKYFTKQEEKGEERKE